jgi:AcrR family transcriptional regulator
MPASHLSNSQPKQPRQRRGERRVAELLAAAADVFAQTGYRAATMSAIAEKAGAPIGSLYQFFPRKEAIAEALLARYVNEIAAEWEEADSFVKNRDLRGLVRDLIRRHIDFSRERPGLSELIEASALFSRPSIRSEARAVFTRTVQRFLSGLAPNLPAERLRHITDVTVQLVKAANALNKQVSRRDSKAVIEEMEFVITKYLEDRLGTESEK